MTAQQTFPGLPGPANCVGIPLQMVSAPISGAFRRWEQTSAGHRFLTAVFMRVNRRVSLCPPFRGLLMPPHLHALNP